MLGSASKHFQLHLRTECASPRREEFWQRSGLLLKLRISLKDILVQTVSNSRPTLTLFSFILDGEKCPQLGTGVQLFLFFCLLHFFLLPFLVPMALYLQQLGARTCHFAKDLQQLGARTSHFAWHLLHFGTPTSHFAWCWLHFWHFDLSCAWYWLHFGTPSVHAGVSRDCWGLHARFL